MSDGVWKPEPQFYKRKDSSVTAIKVDREHFLEIAKWCGGIVEIDGLKKYYRIVVPNVYGNQHAGHGSYLLKDQDGKFWVLEEEEMKYKFDFQPLEVDSRVKAIREANRRRELDPNEI